MKTFLYDKDKYIKHSYRSLNFDIISACNKLGLLSKAVNMADGTDLIIGKGVWSKLVWTKARELNDQYWKMISTIHAENDIIRCTLPSTRYLSWWKLSDVYAS